MALPSDPNIHVAQHHPALLPEGQNSISNNVSPASSSLSGTPTLPLLNNNGGHHHHDTHQQLKNSLHRRGPSHQSNLSMDEFVEADAVSPTADARVKSNATEVQMAYGRLRHFIKATPLHRAHVSLVPGLQKSLWIKAEQTLPTGSFKVRGACNALLLLTEDERSKGCIAASAGNHAQALAYFSRKFGIKCTIYLPTIAPLTKIQSCISLGAEIVIVGENLNASREIAMKVAEERDLCYIHGFNDPAIVNGAGSCGIEIMEQLPDVEVIVVPSGGGGLIAGVGLAAKQRNPNVRIISVETAACPSMIEAHRAGQPVLARTKPSIADGTAVPMVGAHSFKTADPLIDEYIVVEEKWICLAVVRVLEVEKVVLEGSGALGIAAYLSGQLDHIKNKKSCVIFSGGNIDMSSLGRVIERGLLVDKRQIRLRANISDNPGALVDFLSCISELGASVKDIQQERGYIQTRAVWVRVSVETRGKDHTEELLKLLREEKSYHIEVEADPEIIEDPKLPVPKK